MGYGNEYPETVSCPLVEYEIESFDCSIIIDCANRVMKETAIPYKYTAKKNWRIICENCDNRKYFKIDE